MGKNFILCKYQLLLCPSDHYQLSASAKTFFWLDEIRMFIAVARLAMVTDRSKPESVKSCCHFVPVWTAGHQSGND